MKRRPWRTILVIAIWLLVAVAPLAYLSWWASPHMVEPLSVPISLKAGDYTSPFFTTDADDLYQIDIYFLSPDRTPLDIDWKIVDDHGALIANGNYKDQSTGGNNAGLGRYQAKRGSRQRIIVTIHQGENVAGSEPRLHISMPERSLDASYAYIDVLGWAAIVVAVGLITLLVWSSSNRKRKA